MPPTTLSTTCPFTDATPQTVPHAAHIAGAIRLNDVAPTDIRWLWPGRIPLGRVTLLVSDPGLGKSLLTLDIAARVSTAAPWPDQQGARSTEQGNRNDPVPNSPLHAPCSVLLLTAEDDLADTIRPRLEALGADCSRIYAIPALPGQSSENDVPRSFALNRDLARLANLLDSLPDCRLLVVDPISAYLGGVNEHANAEVQNLLVPLAALARQRGLAVLAVSHMRKKDGAAIYRTMGSLAFVAAARAAWVLCKDPDDANRRCFLPLKNNLAPDVTGLAYTIEASDTARAPTIRWSTDPINVSAETIVGSRRPVGRPDDERRHAIQWLQERLSKGPRPTRDIKQEADACGICPRTLRRAFRELSGEAIKQGPFAYGQWLWKLPGIDGQNPGGEFWPSMDFLGDFADLFDPWKHPFTPVSTRAP